MGDDGSRTGDRGRPAAIGPALGVSARVRARHGDFDEAVRLGREAVASFDGTDFIDQEATAHADLADVLRRAGRAEEAAHELRRALELYERKGHLVGAEAARRASPSSRRVHAGLGTSTSLPGTLPAGEAVVGGGGLREGHTLHPTSRLWRRASWTTSRKVVMRAPGGCRERCLGRERFEGERQLSACLSDERYRPPGATKRAARASVSSDPTKSNTTSAGPLSPVKISSSRRTGARRSAPSSAAFWTLSDRFADADEDLRQATQELERELANASRPMSSARDPSASQGVARRTARNEVTPRPRAGQPPPGRASLARRGGGDGERGGYSA